VKEGKFTIEPATVVPDEKLSAHVLFLLKLSKPKRLLNPGSLLQEKRKYY
jgi:hypothetical protein